MLIRGLKAYFFLSVEGYFDDVSQTSDIAFSVESKSSFVYRCRLFLSFCYVQIAECHFLCFSSGSDGVYFVPAFNGLQVNYSRLLKAMAGLVSDQFLILVVQSEHDTC